MRGRTGMSIDGHPFVLALLVFIITSSNAFGAPTFNISGYVQTSSGTGVAMALVAGEGAISVYTQPDGYYLIIVPNHWSGTVTVSKAGWLITPVSKAYNRVSANIANENYTAFQPAISGYTGREGVTVTAGGVGSEVSNSSYYYNITVPYNWSGTVTASLAGYNFPESPRTYSNVTTNISSQNFTPYQPKISGYVKRADGTALSGATVSASGAASTTTDSSGYYEILVTYGWSGTVTANLTGYSFTAKSFTSVTTDQANQDFSGYQPTITGAITAYGAGLEGVTLTASNGGGTAVMNSAGSYTFTVPYGWSGTITPSKPQYTFTPSQRSYSNVIANTASQNYTAILPPVSISGYVRDGNGTGIVSVNITADNGGGNSVTNSSGYYTVNVPYNWSGMVMAKKFGWQITPVNYSYTNLSGNQVGQNFTATYVGIIVKPGGNGDYPTIQAAIDAAVNGEIILLQPGTYRGTGNRDVDFKGKVITVKGATGDPNICIIDCQGTSADPHRGFKLSYGGQNVPVLEAIKIINGYASIDIHSGAGGAIYCTDKAIINKCIISNNSAAYYGGGIYCSSSSIITNCIISNNSSGAFGDGIYIYMYNPTISNCVIRDNYGDGIYSTYYNRPTINKCIIRGNSGAGIAITQSSPTIIECTINNNGKGISNFYYSNLAISRCIISNNSSTYDGGGIYNYSYCNANINNCIIINNSAVGFGGGIYIKDCNNVNIENCTVIDNSADSYGSIYASGTNTITSNCIIWGNQPSQISGGIVKYSNIQGGYLGTGNINVDPLFAADGYHLAGSSPCINAGDPSYVGGPNETDIDGDFRVMLGKIDMGADESPTVSNPVVSGYVKKAVDNLPVADVNVMFSGIGSMMTNADGFFSFEVPVMWTGTISLSKARMENKIINFTNVTGDTNNTYYMNLTYGGGTGDVNDPFRIETAEQMYWLSMQPEHWGKSFLLVNDIDMNEPNAAGFAGIGGGIGTWPPPFRGNFDGGGHVIRNLRLTPTPVQTEQVGLFNCVYIGCGEIHTIKNLGLVNPSITGKYAYSGAAPLIGGSVGVNGCTPGMLIVENCWSEGGKVDGEKGAGGLLGFLEGNVTVRNCFANTAVQTNNGGGGLIGYLNGGKVSNCWAICDVNTSMFDVGGLIGAVYGSDVNNCYARGTVRGNYESGGFAGVNMGSMLSKCYASCTVRGQRNTGGFIGQAVSTTGLLKACFWDSELCPDVNDIGNTTDGNVAGKATEEMKTAATFTGAGWDFAGETANGTADIWTICEWTNTPRFAWQIAPADFICPDGVNFFDFVSFAQQWLSTDCQSSNNCEGSDMDNSGEVDMGDLLEFALWWMEGI